ncbi:MAG: hypothetical protein FD126_124 [Elusimicrobia bacterium]|nr:MAG: hypothetical protein FD126_124 [Elusimicrobiota bacterium]
MTQAPKGRKTVAAPGSLPYTDPVRLRLLVGLASAFLLAADCAQGLTSPQYITHETDDAFLYLDERGVAIRADKNWACRRTWWSPDTNPEIFDKQTYQEFRQKQIDMGTWDQWRCQEIVGPVVFSREVREAQRKMNMAPNKPDCVPWVPETGRLNWETLDYARCYVSKEVERARAAYRDRLSATLAEALRDRTAAYDELVAKAKSERLAFALPGCGKTLRTVHDAAACRMEEEDRLLTKAEGYFAAYSGRIDAKRGEAAISHIEASGIAMDAELIRDTLADAQREADGL